MGGFARGARVTPLTERFAHEMDVGVVGALHRAGVEGAFEGTVSGAEFDPRDSRTRLDWLRAASVRT